MALFFLGASFWAGPLVLESLFLLGIVTDCPETAAFWGLHHSLAEQGLLCGIPEAGGGSSSEPALSGGQRGCCGILSGDKALEAVEGKGSTFLTGPGLAPRALCLGRRESRLDDVGGGEPCGRRGGCGWLRSNSGSDAFN